MENINISSCLKVSKGAKIRNRYNQSESDKLTVRPRALIFGM